MNGLVTRKNSLNYTMCKWLWESTSYCKKFHKKCDKDLCKKVSKLKYDK